MKLIQKIKNKAPNRYFRKGAATMVTMAVVVAVAIGINVAVGAVPESITKIDMTTGGLYTLGDTTKTVVESLQKPVQIYYLVQDGQQDAAVETLLNRYAQQSKNISWELKDPTVYPTFAHNYDDASEGSLIVTCGEKYQVLANYNLYQYDYDYTIGNYDSSFDGENQITSALRYVSSEETPMIYQLKGHNESQLPSDISDRMKQQNLATEQINLLNLEQVPEDAAAVMLVYPQKDLTEHETQLLQSYLDNGGKLMLFGGLPQSDMTNLSGILSQYGLHSTNGLVVEQDSAHIYGGFPNVLLPNIVQNSMTQGADTNGYVLMESCEGIVVDEELPENVTATRLLTTSEQAISKANWTELSTWEKEEGDLQGPFSVGVWAEKTIEDTQSAVVWFGSAGLLDSNADALVNGNNFALVLSVLAGLAGQDVETLGIASKTLAAEYLVVPTADASRWNIICMYVLPFVALVVGIAVAIRRRMA